MKVPYFIKLVLKQILRKFSLKMERLSQIEKFLLQIQKINDENHNAINDPANELLDIFFP